ncbi:MAG: porin [Ignavibacteriaceae bacterium]
MKKYLPALVILFIIMVNNSFGQSEEEPIYDEYIKHFKKDYFTIDMLFQAVADFQPERSIIGNNGFYLSNMRLRMYGNLDKNFSYYFVANFLVSPILLDAVIGYKFTDAFKVSAGQFKAPFSSEFLKYPSDIDFVNRAQAAALLSPRRDIGFQLSGIFANNLLEYKAGIFNGNGPNNFFNDNNSFLYVGRIAATPRTENSRYEIGLNAGYNDNSTQGIFTKSFSGKKTFVGGDFRAEVYNFLFSTEFIMNKLEGMIDSVQAKNEPYGYHITVGYKPLKNHQFLFRYENLSPDGIISNSNFYIIGYNFWPTRVAEIQINYLVDTKQTNFKNHWYLINFQISL